MSWQFDSYDWAILQLRALHLAGQRGRVYFHMAGAGVVGSVHVQPDNGPELAACSCGRFFQPCDGIGGDRCALCADPSVSRDQMEKDLSKVFGGPVEIVEASFGNAAPWERLNPTGYGQRVVRPPWESLNPTGYVPCSCGVMLQNREQLREHWERGHFDELHAQKGSSRS